MRLIIQNEIFERFPDLSIGIVIAKNIDNTKNVDEIHEALRKIEAKLRETLISSELSQHPNIKPWREAYSSFGAKPKNYKCSIEALIKRILSGDFIPSINPLVDIYNFVSLKNMMPVGGDDLDKVEGDIMLRFAQGDEQFRELNSNEIKNPKPGEIVYADDKEILCRRWNWRECDKTKITPETKNVILYAESLLAKKLAEKTTEDLRIIIEKYLDGEFTVEILGKNKTEVEV